MRVRLHLQPARIYIHKAWGVWGGAGAAWFVVFYFVRPLRTRRDEIIHGARACKKMLLAVCREVSGGHMDARQDGGGGGTRLSGRAELGMELGLHNT